MFSLFTYLPARMAMSHTRNTCKRKVCKLTVLKQGTYVEEGFSFDTLNAWQNYWSWSSDLKSVVKINKCAHFLCCSVSKSMKEYQFGEHAEYLLSPLKCEDLLTIKYWWAIIGCEVICKVHLVNLFEVLGGRG
jgi:hypothetical protein